MTDKPVRVRFAPSPTGYFHVGGARTALYNWLYAHRHNGTFILRIEDTDRSRYQEEAEQDLVDSLRWLGLDWDEGPEVGGDYGPYYQSQRLELYEKYAERLLVEGYAYKCFCGSERLASLRERQRATGLRHIGYDRHCRNLTTQEVAEKEGQGIRSVIRLKAPTKGQTSFCDVLRGTTTVENEILEDIVLVKSDGFPTYHLANVVDDHLMEISHIMRGDEWLASCPIHVILYRAFGWVPPVYVHLPLFLDPAGKGKMSKRKTIGPGGREYLVLVKDFRAAGYLPEALINFVARIGWSYDDHTELFTREELVERFSLEGLNVSPARFDYDRLDWMNGVYIRHLGGDDLAARLMPFYREAGLDADLQTVLQVVPIIQERLKKLNDVVSWSGFLFKEEIELDPALLIGRKMDASSSLAALQKARVLVAGIDPFTSEALEQPLRHLASDLGVKAGSLFGILRGAITGQRVSPPLFETMSILGRERACAQMDKGIQVLKNATSDAARE
jgi:glutamyl-tRNA synthetase